MSKLTKATEARWNMPPGQVAIMRSFAKHGLDSVYVPSDLMDLRVCSAMKERGVLQWWEEGDLKGYELTPAGRAALNPDPEPKQADANSTVSGEG